MSGSRPTVVCVGFDAEQLPAELGDALATCACVHHGDVYRALARMERDDPAMVVADVTWLPSVAFEFFEVVARGRRELPVFVLGEDRASERIAEACQRGARGRATAEAIAPWLPRAQAPAAPVLRSPTPPPEPVGNKSDTFAPAGNVFDAELDRRLREQVDAAATEGGLSAGDDERDDLPARPFVEGGVDDEGDEEEYAKETADDGPRVPWLRYTNRPTRVPPKRIPPDRRGLEQPIPEPSKLEPARVEPRPAASVVSSVGQPPPGVADELDPDPPLLTAEEIAALMGDSRRREH